MAMKAGVVMSVPASEVPAAESLEELAASARERRAGAFDELARRIGGRVMAYAFGVLRDKGLAEEAVQETLIRIYRFLPRYDERNFLAWSLTIANRVCMNLIRRERRHIKLTTVLRPVPASDPTSVVGSRVALEAAIASLPAHLAHTFLLHQQGLAYAEIGAVLGVETGTVRSRLSRARDALRETLTGLGEGEGEGERTRQS